MSENILKEIGGILKQERERRSFTISHVSEVLKIRKVYLEGIEQANLDVVKLDAYTLGYIKNYARYLKLNLSDLVLQLKKSVESIQLSSSNDNFENKESVAPSKKTIFFSSSLLVILYMLADFFL